MEHCSICLRIMGRRKRLKLGCGHKFHWKCINRWIVRNGTCPLCRYVCCKKCRDTENQEEDGEQTGFMDNVLLSLNYRDVMPMIVRLVYDSDFEGYNSF